jgi:3'-phosphoadenosine 5'-phosphosulfate sulfotransferase (PAPS reductase)/FAD synthetase
MTDVTDQAAPTCSRCVLSPNVPRVSLDDDGVCNVCLDYESKQDVYDLYFKTEADLVALLEEAKATDSDHDVLLMYSGGKDSTYVLYRLVEMGCRVLALTFDNGYIPAGCFENIRGVCEGLGVDSVVVNVDQAKMDEVFAESLKQESTVCSGCFRGLTARGTKLAIDRRIPIVMTGLSRGQIFDTKVHPLASKGITDPDQIEGFLQQFRELYHSANDRIAELIDDQALADPDSFRKTRFVDFFRYSPVTKRDIITLITERAPFWRKPENVGGCSSNCMINDAGIQVHLETRGYHNYAIPLAWDVRFGHISRDEAMGEMQADVDPVRVDIILNKIGFTPSQPPVPPGE